MRPFTVPRNRRVVSCLAVLLLAVSVASGQTAVDSDVERIRRQHRERFLEQQRPPEPLTRMAATPCVDGFAGVYPCNNVDLLAFLPLGTIGGSAGNDIWGWTDPDTGREYALMGRASGLAIVDIGDPVNPVYLGNLPTHTSSSSWRDVKVYANHAYIVSEAFNHGMQVFDLTELRSVVNPPVTFSETAHYDDFGSAHNIAIDEDTGFAYAVGTATCAGGLHMVDLANPVAPVFAGCHNEDQYTHDSQCVIYHGPDAEHVGREICINSNVSKINVVDVTNKTAPTVLSTVVYSGWNYIHQGWLTEDHVYYMQGDEGDEQTFGHNTRTRIFDMSDLDAPQLVGIVDGPTRAIDHNLYVRDGYVFEANYTAGLRVLDVAEVGSALLPEVAFFDIYPSSDQATFNGAWSVYPYFESGVVVVSGIEQGLFVLWPNLAPTFRVEVDPPELSVCDPSDATATVTLRDQNDYTGEVTLSLTGLPVGADYEYVPQPAAVPGESTLTVTTSGSAQGSYPLTLSATDGSQTRNADLTLRVSDAVPQPALTESPADGQLDVSPLPTLKWAAVGQTRSYDVQIALDPGFSAIVYRVSTGATQHMVQTALDRGATFYWRVRASNACGFGDYSPVASFSTISLPGILLIDDDDNQPDVRESYELALEFMGREYDLWNTANSDAEPNAGFLDAYTTVVWFTGAESGGFAGPGPGGESALASWLDRSGCLLISSQDYYRDRGLSGLMTSHLGVGSAVSDEGHTVADGQGQPFGGLGPYTLALPYTNYTDTINPGQGASTAFRASPGKIAVSKETELYRTTYLGFGVEGLSLGGAQEVLGAFLGWCDELAAADADADGTANGPDCAPADGETWDAPSPVSGLVVGTSGPDSLLWQPPLEPGGTTVLYDVLRSDDPASFLAAVCVESGGADTVASETADPFPGQLFAYLIRSRNACGGTLGLPPTRDGGSCP